MRKWLEKNAPGSWKFFSDFFDALNNKPGGHSLRKWLAVGFFWLTATLCIRYTDATNVIAVITILCSMITSLVITYSVSNYKEKQIETPSTPQPAADEQKQPDSV